jgi:hypothetical protein
MEQRGTWERSGTPKRIRTEGINGRRCDRGLSTTHTGLVLESPGSTAEPWTFGVMSTTMINLFKSDPATTSSEAGSNTQRFYKVEGDWWEGNLSMIESWGKYQRHQTHPYLAKSEQRTIISNVGGNGQATRTRPSHLAGQ